ncbi:hypothetical protein ACQ4PT_038966 [Festuca glaucescens]
MEKKNAPAAVAPEPVASEPVAAEPVASEAVAAEPVASEAVAAEPVASEGGASKRGASVNWASLMADGPLHKIGQCLLANEDRKSSSPSPQRNTTFLFPAPPSSLVLLFLPKTPAPTPPPRQSAFAPTRKPPPPPSSVLTCASAGGSDPAGEMLGGILSKILLLLFGYAMPAFECFKTVEERPNDAHMLRFWCQYWIIVAMVIAFESLISWMPMYGEMKLAFFVYLWYPKTKGSDVVYDTFLRPIVMQYEPNIEHRLLHLRAKSGQLLNFYVKNFADKGTAFFMDVLRYVVSDRLKDPI